MFFTYLLLAISTSIDSIGIGTTYGIRNIQISKSAKIILFLISFVIASLAMAIGGSLSHFLPPFITNLIGSGILFFMGILIIFQTLREKNPKNKENNKNENITKKNKKVYRFFIKWLGITIEIIHDASTCDLDCSRKIEGKEAIYLGIALSLDSFSVGVGSGMISNISFLFPVLVSLFQIIFLSLGRRLGLKAQKHSHIPSYLWNLIAGILLIMIGVIRLFI